MHIASKVIIGGVLMLFAACGNTLTPEEELARIKQNYAKMLLPSATDKYHLNAAFTDVLVFSNR